MTQDQLRNHIQLRERMLGALSALETMRPFIDTARNKALFTSAWEILWQEAAVATAAFVESSRG